MKVKYKVKKVIKFPKNGGSIMIPFDTIDQGDDILAKLKKMGYDWSDPDGVSRPIWSKGTCIGLYKSSYSNNTVIVYSTTLWKSLKKKTGSITLLSYEEFINNEIAFIDEGQI